MKRVFISFRSEDKQRIQGIRLMAANPKFDVEFYDESVRIAIKSNNNAYVRSVIRDKINRTSVTLCMVSELTYTSEWVTWELEESFEKGSTVITMGFPNGPDRLVLPAPIKSRGLGFRLWDYDLLGRLIEAAP